MPDWRRSVEMILDARQSTDQAEEMTQTTAKMLRLILEEIETGKRRVAYLRVVSLEPREAKGNGLVAAAREDAGRGEGD